MLVSYSQQSVIKVNTSILLMLPTHLNIAACLRFTSVSAVKDGGSTDLPLFSMGKVDKSHYDCQLNNQKPVN